MQNIMGSAPSKKNFIFNFYSLFLFIPLIAYFKVSWAEELNLQVDNFLVHGPGGDSAAAEERGQRARVAPGVSPH